LRSWKKVESSEMSVKLKKLRGSWYIVIDHKGLRKTKKVGGTLEFARCVMREVQEKLTRNELGILNKENTSPLFSAYSEQWLRNHGHNIQASTKRSYEQLLRLHVTPHFGNKPLNKITRDDVKEFVSTISEKRDHSRNTIRLIVTSLRAVLSAALEDKLIDSNPASKVGKFNKRERGQNKAQAMTTEEALGFLSACVEVCPEYYALFFTALRSGLRKSELIALKWGDIQFGESEDDKNRFLLVQRHYYMGHYGTSKTHTCRRVDMSKQLRTVLMARKEDALLRAFQLGKTSVVDELVFPSEAGTPICPDNIGPRYMGPALEKAGLRKFRFHDLRHTFGSLLIQAGVSPAYVQKQMGHRSIQVTIDVYGHLIPGENVAWIDTLDRTPKKVAPTDANRTQTRSRESEEDFSDPAQSTVLERVIWLPPRDSNPDMLIQSQLSCR
jgi:integrase